ncbi:MAG: ferredoxin [Actinomycetota bacterium]|nr:ferredoxin [Actinomycetota bacterium]
MKVWIDQDECMGAGTCEQVAPEVFEERADGLWVVREDEAHFSTTTVFDGRQATGHGPAGVNGLARVPETLIEQVLDAAEECPGECIYAEV